MQRPRPLCKVCPPRWDTLEVVPKASLRMMDFRDKGGCAPRPCCCWVGFQPRAHTSGGSSPKLQKPFTLPGATSPFFGGVFHPEFQGWGFSHALFGGTKLPDENPWIWEVPCGFPAPLGGRGRPRGAASIKHLGLISLFTTGSLGATFMAREVIWCPLETTAQSGSLGSAALPPLVPLGLCFPLAARK